jgi:hypothetical protein
MFPEDECPTETAMLKNISMILNDVHRVLFGRRVPERVHCAFATTFRTVLQQRFGNVRHVLCARTVDPDTSIEHIERTAVTTNDLLHACVRNWLISVGYEVGRLPARDPLCMHIFNNMMIEDALLQPRSEERRVKKVQRDE